MSECSNSEEGGSSVGDNRYEYHSFAFAASKRKALVRERRGYVRLSTYAIVFVMMCVFV